MNTSSNDIRICVVIPTYNNAATIADVITAVRPHCPDIFVFNDGSTDTTEPLLAAIPGIKVHSFRHNKGKGHALKKAFELARHEGFTHAITMDADGQHLAIDLPEFRERIEADPTAVFIGTRDIPFEQSVKVPGKSSFGRSFGNFWYQFITGITLHDTQCGFRACPLEPILAFGLHGGRYEYEQELLITAAWKGLPVVEVPIRLYYQPESERVSHFRPLADFLRISKINSVSAAMRMILPPEALAESGGTFREKLANLFLHELRSNTTPNRFAFSLGLGVCVALMPHHGFQMLSLIALSAALPINRPIAFLGLAVSSAPLLPLIIWAEVSVGAFLLHGHTGIQGTGIAQSIANFGIEFILGSLVLAPIVGLATYLCALPIGLVMAKRRRK